MAHGRPAVPRTGSEKSEIRAGAQRTLLQSQETDRHQGHARAAERASALASMNPLVPPPSGRPQGFHTAWKAGTQYAAAVVLTKGACGYWIPAFAGMTMECRATAGTTGSPALILERFEHGF